ncbi:hypothetical protein GCM10028805_10200 [Spirosoma harenae]
MHKLQFIILCFLSLIGLASCSPEDVSTSNASELANIQSYVTTKGISGSFTSSGLYYSVSKPSTSTVVPAFGQELELMYTLSTITPSESNTAVIVDKAVDTTYAKTSTFFPFFEGALKAGLQEGLLKMHEGETAIMLMPSSLAFKSIGSTSPLIAANIPVRYDVSLIRARTEEQQINEYIAANKLTVLTTTASGIRLIMRTANPTGDSVKTALATNKTIQANYVGKQLRAKTAIGFDSTSTGLNQYNVTGFNDGLKLLRVGDKATLIFPSTVGYSTTGLLINNIYKIAPNTPLLYNIDVISAK